jgi:hypothetical protein
VLIRKQAPLLRKVPASHAIASLSAFVVHTTAVALETPVQGAHVLLGVT